MPTPRVLVIFALLALLATSCGALPVTITFGAQVPTQDVGPIVRATLQALAAQASATPSSTPLPPTAEAGTASISGTLNYAADTLPAMNVTAYQVGTQNYKFVVTNPGQRAYQIDGLVPGTYHVVAYTIGGGAVPQGLAGGYTRAVPCGLGADCSDHSLIDVTLTAGQAAAGVNPSDWYAAAGTFPTFPQQAAAAPAATATSAPAATATSAPPVGAGSISGNLKFPASAIPALRIVAFQVGGSATYSVDTALGQSSYELDQVPAGTYHVVAYTLASGGFTAGLAGGYSQMVPCGLQYGCSDHTLIDVVVFSAKTTMGVDPNDYYADPGTFPTMPTP